MQALARKRREPKMCMVVVSDLLHPAAIPDHVMAGPSAWSPDLPVHGIKFPRFSFVAPMPTPCHNKRFLELTTAERKSLRCWVLRYRWSGCFAGRQRVAQVDCVFLRNYQISFEIPPFEWTPSQSRHRHHPQHHHPHREHSHQSRRTVFVLLHVATGGNCNHHCGKISHIAKTAAKTIVRTPTQPHTQTQTQTHTTQNTQTNTHTHYNNSILEDIYFVDHLELLNQSLNQCPRLRDTIILFKVRFQLGGSFRVMTNCKLMCAGMAATKRTRWSDRQFQWLSHVAVDGPFACHASDSS